MIKKRKPQYSRTAPIPWNLEPLKGHMWLVILFVVPCTCLAVPGPSTEKQHRMIFSAIKVDEGDIVVRSGEKPGKRSVNWETVRTVNGELVNITWPVKRVASEEGDIILGGLMMVHEREEESTCGRIMRQGGIQALEAMLYTIDYVNRKQFHNHTSFLPGFTLGAYILDDCDKDTYGLEMAVDFIKGMLVNLHGGERGSVHDSRMFSESDLLPKLNQKMAGFGKEYRIYGDSGYGENELLARPFSSAACLTDRVKRQQNFAMSSVRQSVEWAFKEINSRFAFVDFRKQMKLLEKPVNVLYRVAVLLSNCHNCLKPNQTSKYFELEPPCLEEYLEN